jgi:hypothetical protein
MSTINAPVNSLKRADTKPDVPVIEMDSEEMALALWDLVDLTNKMSRTFNGGRLNTCILASYALNDVLRRLGLQAYPLRVTTIVSPADRRLVATVMGKSYLEYVPGKWNGHLVVAIEKAWLLDPTLDQANRQEWPATSLIRPVVVKLTEEFWAGGMVGLHINGTSVGYLLHKRQQGFARAPAARPSQWKPVADSILDELASRFWKKQCGVLLRQTHDLAAKNHDNLGAPEISGKTENGCGRPSGRPERAFAGSE